MNPTTPLPIPSSAPGAPRPACRRSLFRRVAAAIAATGCFCAAIAAPVRTEAALEPLTIKKKFTELSLGAGDEESYDLAEYIHPRTRVDITFKVANEERVASFELYDEHAPKNVANFLRYINGYENPKGEKSDYINSFIHRLSKDFVVQGGGFKFDSEIGTENPDAYSEVRVIESVTNEFKLRNVRGTLSMAKRGGDPDSATSQWFVNLADNTTNLDNQNGGFTVFGSVLDEGNMKIFDEINAIDAADVKDLTTGVFANIKSDDESYAIAGACTEVPFIGGKPIYITKTESSPVKFVYSITKMPKTGYLSAAIDNGKLLLKVIGNPEKEETEVITITTRSTHENEISQDVTVHLYPSSTKVFVEPISPGKYVQMEIDDLNLSRYEDGASFYVIDGELSFDGKKWLKKGTLPANKNEIEKFWIRVKGTKELATEIEAQLIIGVEAVPVRKVIAHTGTPDLLISDYRIIKSGSLAENGKFDVEMTVKNQGDAISNAVKASVFYNVAVVDSLSGRPNKATKTANIPKLGPGEEKTIVIRGIVAKLPKPDESTVAGDIAVPVHIVVDAEKKLADSFRDNNTKSTSVQVCQPDVGIYNFEVRNSQTGVVYEWSYDEENDCYDVRIPGYAEFEFAALFANYGYVASKAYKLNAFYSDESGYFDGKGATITKESQFKPIKSTSVPKIVPMSVLRDGKGNVRVISLKKMPNPIPSTFYVEIYLDISYSSKIHHWTKANPRESSAGNMVVLRVVKE